MTGLITTLTLIVMFVVGVTFLLSSARNLRESWIAGRANHADPIFIGWWLCHTLMYATQLAVGIVEKGGVL